MRPTRLAAWLALAILGASCQSAQPRAAASPTPVVASLPGGCGQTAITDALPPEWARAGWSDTEGPAWPVPWAMASSGDAIAYLFAGELVAGPSPRKNGSNNKILWVIREPAPFVVTGTPIDRQAPVVTVPGGPSIVDVPSPGCWRFQLKLQSDGRLVGMFDLEVLPHGAAPP